MKNRKDLDREFRSWTFMKNHPGDQIWWVDQVEAKGPLYFSFDQETIFNFWPDYPDNLTADQKELFDKENPFWAAFYLGEDQAYLAKLRRKEKREK